MSFFKACKSKYRNTLHFCKLKICVQFKEIKDTTDNEIDKYKEGGIDGSHFAENQQYQKQANYLR